jgi:hypothetical protein
MMLWIETPADDGMSRSGTVTCERGATDAQLTHRHGWNAEMLWLVGDAVLAGSVTQNSLKDLCQWNLNFRDVQHY